MLGCDSKSSQGGISGGADLDDNRNALITLALERSCHRVSLKVSQPQRSEGCVFLDSSCVADMDGLSRF